MNCLLCKSLQLLRLVYIGRRRMTLPHLHLPLHLRVKEMTFLLHLGSLISQKCRHQSQSLFLSKALQLIQRFHLPCLKTMAHLAGQCETQENLLKTNGSRLVALKLMLGRLFLRRRHLGKQKNQWTCRKGFRTSSLCEMQPLMTLPSASPSN